MLIERLVDSHLLISLDNWLKQGKNYLWVKFVVLSHTMKNKSDENLKCARLAKDNGYYSAGMSRCYYSMFQMALHYLEIVVSTGKLDSKVYETKKRNHGEVQGLLQRHGVGGVENEHFGTVMSFRKKADYTPDEISPKTLESCLTKAARFRQRITEEVGRIAQ